MTCSRNGSQISWLAAGCPCWKARAGWQSRPAHAQCGEPAPRGSEAPTTLSAEEVGAALQTARRGTAARLSGATAEHYRLLLEEEVFFLEAFAKVATLLARAEVPGKRCMRWRWESSRRCRNPMEGWEALPPVTRCDGLWPAPWRALISLPGPSSSLSARGRHDALASMPRAAVELDADTVVVSLDSKCADDTGAMPKRCLVPVFVFAVTFPGFPWGQFHTSTLPLSTLPHFHTSTLPHFHTSTLPHFHTSTLPRPFVLTFPHFHISMLRLFHASILPQFHTC